jgi:3',5'-cyclic AMP phosphodiesterase CpdA
MHKGMYGQTGKTAFFDAWASTLDKYGVDLVLNGHDHVYVRTYPMRNDQRAPGGTVYLQSGGSGQKRGSSGAVLPYQEVQAFHSVPAFSAITVTRDRLIIETKTVDVNPEIPVMAPFQWFQIIKTGSPLSLLPWRNLQEYRLAG